MTNRLTYTQSQTPVKVLLNSRYIGSIDRAGKHFYLTINGVYWKPDGSESENGCRTSKKFPTIMEAKTFLSKRYAAE